MNSDISRDKHQDSNVDIHSQRKKVYRKSEDRVVGRQRKLEKNIDIVIQKVGKKNFF